MNLALNKNTDQTGLKKEKQKFRSGQAVDGNVMTCAKTNKTLNPTWWVDLDGGAVVREVTLKRLGPGKCYCPCELHLENMFDGKTGICRGILFFLFCSKT